MHDIVETHVLSMCMALHSNFTAMGKRTTRCSGTPPGCPCTFSSALRQRISRHLNARESVEATMLQCLQSNGAMAHDGGILPFFGGPGTPQTSTAPSRKGTERHKLDVVTIVAPGGNPGTHVGNHDFITFRRGMQCATCRQVARICCNTCLVCHACFSGGPHPCTLVVLNVVDDVCEDGENNNADESATPRNPYKRRGVAGMLSKLLWQRKMASCGIGLGPRYRTVSMYLV